MRVLIIYDHITDEAAAPPDQADALVQARAISAALESLGHEWMTLGVTLDLDAARQAIERLQPDIAFNLVESLGGSGQLIAVLPALLDTMGIPYTGATADAQFITSHKPLAKQLMKAAGIATPEWVTIEQLRRMVESEVAARLPAGRWLIKSLWEHASVGLDAQSLIETDQPARLLHEIESRLDRLGGSGFAELYIDGREFNIALLCDPVIQQPQTLPPAEIVFHDFPPERPCIVNYDCKWNEESFEYQHTERVFDFVEDDQPLLAQLTELARACWVIFELRGYARVDFRVDSAGKPWVLEVNTNPCLSPDAGFAAALEHGKIEYVRAIERILENSLRAPHAAQTRTSGLVAQATSPETQVHHSS